MTATIIFSFAICVLVETVAILAYTVYKIRKDLKETQEELNETADSLDNLAEYVLKLSKSVPRVEIVESDRNNATNFMFPNSDGI